LFVRRAKRITGLIYLSYKWIGRSEFQSFFEMFILRHMNEFVCHQSGAICAVESSNDAVCRCQAPGISGEQANSLR